MESFKHLGLSNPVLKVISELGFEKPSAIQEKAIPQLLEKDTDFIGLAQTGTGKTAAFALPLLERIDTTQKATQGLILAPTRELGQQIAEQVTIFGKYLNKVNVLAVYGGTSIYNQIKALRKQSQHIIIATPGRLIDLIQRKAVKLDHLKYLILDEADEMLNMGFKQEIDTILSHTAEEKNVWLFSATMSSDIRRIVKKYMDSPAEVKLSVKNETNANIDHQFAVVKPAYKAEALTRFLDMEPTMRGVVFCRTKRDTQNLAEELLKKNYKADALHGDLSQQQRDRVMRRFKSHDLQVLIATDIAARGIDVNDLTHVFHFNLPDDIAYYTHRSGRTARAGKKGTSIALIGSRDRSKISKLVKQLDISFTKVLVPKPHDIYDIKVENWCHKILNKSIKSKVEEVNPALLEKANLLFGNLSKEELLTKVLLSELEKFTLDSSRDLNEVLANNTYRRERRNGNNYSRGRNRGDKGGRSNKRKFSRRRR